MSRRRRGRRVTWCVVTALTAQGAQRVVYRGTVDLRPGTFHGSSQLTADVNTPREPTLTPTLLTTVLKCLQD